ncbi:MAG: glutamate-1-semialdehyde 2,1-aminomutase [Syntrophomonadaceae bacterium]|nr:glutamate-1-semialdehyde 2,1-aminomutase [Syntrophomonadaceae bacterium]
MAGKTSVELFERAQRVIPGGVNSPVRAFKAVGLNPLFIAAARGARVYDVDGNEYLDYVCSWGPLILGHAYPAVVEAISNAAVRGTSYGAPCEAEVDLATMICEAFPSIDLVRMVNSGTEATMSAVRVARAFTGRNKIVKFEGCYHGHGDSFLIKAGAGLLTAGVPSSPGIPGEVAAQTLTARFNDLESVQSLFAQYGSDIAAVIVEPVAGNMGLVVSDLLFLTGLRKLTRQYGALLIFDEVITGFRVRYGGYQDMVGITPDLTCLGKIIGGGLPVGAYGGKREVMELVAPQGPVYQAGTLSGNPLAMAAGGATLKELQRAALYEEIGELGALLEARIRSLVEARGIKLAFNRLGSMFSWFFTGKAVVDYASALTADTVRYARFFAGMLEQGIYLPPSQFEVCFISAAHTIEDIEATVQAFDRALDKAFS